MIQVGERGRTITAVDRRPFFWIPPGKNGTVIKANSNNIIIQMDEYIEGCEMNQVCFTPATCGVYWWQTMLTTVEQVYRYHFARIPDAVRGEPT